MKSSTQARHPGAYRGVVVVKVAVLLVVLLGFSALAIDLGAVYNAKAELQRTADAAALAAAAMLGECRDGDPLATARATAVEYTLANPVFGRSLTIDPQQDVTFGRAVYNEALGRFTFTPTDMQPDAVKVRVRHTDGSPNGSFPLFFGNVLGKGSMDLSATATAMMVPRDMAIVADLSASHNDDSELRHYRMTQINLHDVWDGFPGGIDDSPEEWAGLGYSADDPQAAGPAWGYMKYLGYGTHPVTAGYNPTADVGLVALPFNQNWSDQTVETYLTGFASLGYSPDEIDAIMSRAYDLSGAWQVRVAVALGLARWDSGLPGGLWERLGIEPTDAGDGNNQVGDNELVWVEQIGERNLADSRALWEGYISEYMNRNGTQLCAANKDFQYRFGIKTFINYLLEVRPSHADVPEFANTNAQPMQAVKDATRHMMEQLVELDANDQVSLEVYGTTARHEIDLTTEHEQVSGRLADMQAGHYDIWTNMGGGIQRGIEELTSERGRSASRKIIILLTDGYANVNEYGDTGDYPGGQAYALQKAHEAAGQGISIFAVSVGAWSDTQVMEDIAEIGSGEHFHADGSIEDYSEQLDQIFYTLGGRRPVDLIE